MRFAGTFYLGILCLGRMFGTEPGTDRMAHLPLAFERAQTKDPSYVARGSGYFLEVRPRENVLTLADVPAKKRTTVYTRFLGAGRSGTIYALDTLPSRTNYFLGGAPSSWRTNVAEYGRVRVDGLYPGVDLVFYGTAGQLEYDFIVHSGADPRCIRFEIEGPVVPSVNASGDLLLSAGGQEVRWKAPSIYQIAGGRRTPVPGRFQLAGHRVRFQLGSYDSTRDLVIDPVLSYVSYLGGHGNDMARAIATDATGNVYIAGASTSSNLPVTATALQPAYGGQTNSDFSGDAFVAKFSPAGALMYLTYLGGNADDFATSIAVDSAGDAYVAGMTNSTNFPATAGAYQKAFGGYGGNTCERGGDAFVAKLNPTGSQLVYATYLGGQKDEAATAIAIDSSGNAYVTGGTISANFPTTPGAYQTALRGLGGQAGKPYCGGGSYFNSGDAFVAKLNPAGSQLVFSTYLGGALDDFALTIALDSSQNVYVGGYTLSRDFPTTTGALQSGFHGIEQQNVFFNTGDGFVARLSSSGAALEYATYLGGSGDDAVVGIAAASDGTLWVTGNTTSHDFPVTKDATQRSYAGYSLLPFEVEQLTGDAFVSHINPTGTALLFSTYLGGVQNDMGEAIAVDTTGLVYVAGFTDSSNFPFTNNALQKVIGGDGGSGQFFQYGDGFITVLDPTVPRVVYSSYFGGSRDDELLALALDGTGGVWATGGTVSPGSGCKQ